MHILMQPTTLLPWKQRQ